MQPVPLLSAHVSRILEEHEAADSEGEEEAICTADRVAIPTSEDHFATRISLRTSGSASVSASITHGGDVYQRASNVDGVCEADDVSEADAAGVTADIIGQLSDDTDIETQEYDCVFHVSKLGSMLSDLCAGSLEGYSSAFLRGIT